MKAKREDDQRTRRRLVEVATRLFAELGYKHVTIRAICREARANVAAVNYHFRDKMGLYGEVLESAFAILRETTAKAIEAGEGRSAEEKLRAYIRVHCEGILSVSGPSAVQNLIYREMQEPTVGLNTIVDRTLKPRFEYLFAVVGEVLGLPADDERVTLSAISIHGLIIMFRRNPVADRMGEQLNLSFTPDGIAAHLLAFSMAAIEAYRSPRRVRRTTRRRRIRQS